VNQEKNPSLVFLSLVKDLFAPSFSSAMMNMLAMLARYQDDKVERPPCFPAVTSTSTSSNTCDGSVASAPLEQASILRNRRTRVDVAVARSDRKSSDAFDDPVPIYQDTASSKLEEQELAKLVQVTGRIKNLALGLKAALQVDRQVLEHATDQLEATFHAVARENERFRSYLASSSGSRLSACSLMGSVIGLFSLALLVILIIPKH
jgi:hypothetical protein